MPILGRMLSISFKLLCVRLRAASDKSSCSSLCGLYGSYTLYFSEWTRRIPYRLLREILRTCLSSQIKRLSRTLAICTNVFDVSPSFSFWYVSDSILDSASASPLAKPFAMDEKNLRKQKSNNSLLIVRKLQKQTVLSVCVVSDRAQACEKRCS